MAKTITIREEVYKNLKRIKKKDESFSELFQRLIKSTSSVDVLEKLRGSVSFRDKKKMLLEIHSKRAETR